FAASARRTYLRGRPVDLETPTGTLLRRRQVCGSAPYPAVYARRVHRPIDPSASAAVEPAGGAAPGAGAGATGPSERAVRRARRLVPVALALAATLAYGLLGSQQFHQLVARSWDL